MRAPSLCDKARDWEGDATRHGENPERRSGIRIRRIPAKMTGFGTLASYTTPTRMAVIVWPNEATLYLVAVFCKG